MTSSDFRRASFNTVSLSFSSIFVVSVSSVSVSVFSILSLSSTLLFSVVNSGGFQTTGSYGVSVFVVPSCCDIVTSDSGVSLSLSQPPHPCHHPHHLP